jgi:hypothetical protein
MGWSGYGIYDGDGTQTCHYDFIKWAKIEKNHDVICDWLTNKGTVLPKDKVSLLKKNYKLILNKMKKPRFWDEDSAIEWQMLLSLFLDNNVKPPKMILETGIEATQYLIEKCCRNFHNPGARKRALNNFINSTINYGRRSINGR